MRTPILSLCLALLLGGCAFLKKDEAPVCDGQHRRPANPNGSVLEASTLPVPLSRPAKLSAAPMLFASCA